MTPARLRLYRTKGFNLQAVSMMTNGLPAVNVARPSRWGNPFPDRIGRELCVTMFRELMDGFFNPYQLSHLTDDEFRPIFNAKERFQKRLNWGLELQSGARHELRGKNLACWCRPEHLCHADVLLEIANK